jgi:hypothetical protein
MRFPDPATLRSNAQRLRREELSRIAEASAIEWSTLIRRIRASFSRPTCPVPARNHHLA